MTTSKTYLVTVAILSAHVIFVNVFGINLNSDLSSKNPFCIFRPSCNNFNTLLCTNKHIFEQIDVIMFVCLTCV